MHDTETLSTVSTVSTVPEAEADQAMIEGAYLEPSEYAVSDASGFGPEVFEALPPAIANLAALYESPDEQDVFTCGLLGSLGSLLPNVLFRHRRKYLSPTSYVCVTAPPGIGKGALSDWQRALGAIAARYDKHNENERTLFEERRQHAEETGKETPPEPPKRRLFIPANSSATPFLRALSDNEGRGLVYATEIYPLTTARAAEWGDYTALLLQGWYHDRADLLRSTFEVVIERPSPSVVLSGTPDQLRTLIPSTEDGLFSRFGFYTFRGTDEWLDHGAAAETDTFDSTLSDLSELLADVHFRLESRDVPLYVDLSRQDWDVLQAAPRRYKAEALRTGRRDLISLAHRAPVLGARFAVGLTAISAALSGRAGLAVSSLQVTPEALAAGASAARTMLDHGFRLASTLDRPSTRTNDAGDAARDFLHALPHRVNRSVLLDVADSMGLSQSVAYKYRKMLLQSGRLVPDGHGWVARAPSISPAALTVETVETRKAALKTNQTDHSAPIPDFPRSVETGDGSVESSPDAPF